MNFKKTKLSVKDKRIIDKIDRHSIAENQRNISYLDEIVEKYSEQHDKWSDEEYQLKREKESKKSLIDKVKEDKNITSEQIDDLIQKYESENLLSKKEKRKLEGLRDIRKASETVKPTITQTPKKK